MIMKMQPEASWIEKMAQGIGLIPDLTESETPKSEMREPGPLSSYPPPERWDDWEEYEAPPTVTLLTPTLSLAFTVYVTVLFLIMRLNRIKQKCIN